MFLSRCAPHQMVSPHPARRGITLLEVLISMFVLMFGLLGVASLLPVGKYHASRSLGYDQAAAVGQAAYQEIQVRGLLQPRNWTDSSNTLLTSSAVPPFQFDPVATTPILGMTLVKQPGYTQGTAAQGVFSSRDDLSIELPDDGSLPAIQSKSIATRNYQGEYSWMFTVTPNNAATEGLHTVSVVVFRNRDVSQETTFQDVEAGWEAGGRTLRMEGTPEQMGRLEKGTWVLLSYPSENYFSWYRILAVKSDGDSLGFRVLDVKGRKYRPTQSLTMNVSVFDQVVMVYERSMRVDELNSAYSVLP